MTNQMILVVEDEILIARDLEYLLEDLGYRVPLVAATSDEALAAIRTFSPDLVLLDIHLANGSDGFTVAEWLVDHTDIPVVFLTAHADMATVQRAQETHPYAYLLKPFNERDLGITVQMVLAKNASDRELRNKERLLSTTLHSITDGVIITNTSDTVTYLNPRAEHITGWSCGDAMGQRLPDIFVTQCIDTIPSTASLPIGATSLVDQVLINRNGTFCLIEDTIAPIADDKGRQYGSVVVFRDVTQRRKLETEQQRLEQKLLQTQRVESLSVLVSSVAHDFNNILMSILGYTLLADEQLVANTEAHEYLEQSVIGIQRATELTTQLRAYAGHNQSIIRPVAINAIVRELTSLLHHSISHHALLELELSEDAPMVLGNATQLHQVILNLLTNAIDALDDTQGTILVRTEAVQMTDADAAQLIYGKHLIPGRYICVTVRDTGCGMSPETLTNIFDPFFTTKSSGRGLGLAAVKGIIRGHAGALRVESMIDYGTTFQVYLPSADTSAAVVPPTVDTTYDLNATV